MNGVIMRAVGGPIASSECDLGEVSQKSDFACLSLAGQETTVVPFPAFSVVGTLGCKLCLTVPLLQDSNWWKYLRACLALAGFLVADMYVSLSQAGGTHKWQKGVSACCCWAGRKVLQKRKDVSVW